MRLILMNLETALFNGTDEVCQNPNLHFIAKNYVDAQNFPVSKMLVELNPKDLENREDIGFQSYLPC